MRISVLNSGPGGWHVEDLRRAAVARGHEVSVVSWRHLSDRVGCDGPTLLDDAEIVILRNMPAGSLEQIVFRMDLIGRLAAAGKCVINPPRAIEVAVDKYLALSRMAAAGLHVPPTIVCQRPSDALAAFDELGGDIVLKPLFGSEGVGITRITDRDLAERAFNMLDRMSSVIYVQKFIDHGGGDLRLFVIGKQVVASMRRVGAGWKTNIAQGGRGEPFSPTDELRDVALRAAAACETLVTGVDILMDQTDRPIVLEVNGVPGWQTISAVTGVDIAERIVEFAENDATD